ncbi:MAG TPA: hypothetical protein VJR05_13355 [Acidimicrobiia bacterium]|nr:hypothetical protein [Acidimicrobiia bacterium]
MTTYPLLYLEHLNPADLGVLARAAGFEEDPGRLRTRLRDQPEALDQLLSSPTVYESLFGRELFDPGNRISPFLLFGVLVHRAAADLDQVSYVAEWTGPNQRLPILDVGSLREVVEAGSRRFFLIELLTSFTRVASGSTLIRTRRGYRRRRFSELDPVSLVGMVEQLPVEQRPAGYRRLGDVALFLCGVFPDHTARHPLRPADWHLLAESAGVASPVDHELDAYEKVGAGWYRRTVETATGMAGAGPRILLEVADRFQAARRFLNYVTDRYLYRFESGLTGPG